MNTKRWLGVLIVAAWLSGSAAPAQERGEQPIYPPPSPLAPNAEIERQPGAIVPAGGVLSDWIVYRRECCEGPEGRYTPLYTELYVNAGPTMPIGGDTLSRELQTGWTITGGARALFFNESLTRAWVFDLHLINTNLSGGAQDTQFPVTFFQNGTRSDLVNFLGVTGRKTFSVHNYNRTLVGLGVGRAWYPWQPADSDNCKLRFVADAGGRYGSGRVAFKEFGHVVDVIGQIYAGLRSELEFPCYGCMVHVGGRCEWAYTWSDVLQRQSNTQEISALLTLGVRY
jgi:hypothetical protein